MAEVRKMPLPEQLKGLTDGILRTLSELNGWRPEFMWDRSHRVARSLVLDMEATVEKPVYFDFVNVEVDEALLSFGSDLSKNGMLKLPFRDCVFTFRDLTYGPQKVPLTHICASQILPGTSDLRDAFGGIGDPTVTYTGAWLVMRSPLPQYANTVSLEAFAQHEIGPTVDPHWSTVRPAVGDVFVKGGFQKGGITLVTTMVEVACALLVSKGIKHIIDKPPERVQARRARDGRPPLPERHTIIVPVAVPARGAGAGGTHASPRPHWRRGHIRKYSDGKVTMVSPCIVNADGSAIEPRQYQMGSQKEAAE